MAILLVGQRQQWLLMSLQSACPLPVARTLPHTAALCRQQLQWMKELMGQIDSKINASHEQVRRRSRQATSGYSAYSAQSTTEDTVEAAGLPSSPASDRYYHSEHSRPLPCTGF